MGQEMAIPIQAYVRDADTLIQLEPEDLAAVCLEILNKQRERLLRVVHVTGTMFEGNPPAPEFPYGRKDEILQALAEAWQWLKREGLIVEAIDQRLESGWHVITRRGR